MSLISVGVDHEHASLDFLERVTVPEHQWSKVLRDLVSHANIHEAVFVSTCLRTEVVAVIDLFHGAIEEITTTLATATGLDAHDFDDRLSVHFDRGVVTHLFSVAAGLKSAVPGEFEVLGQLRRALELAIEEQSAGAELDDLFRRAIASGRHVRHETPISRGTTSFAQAAASLAAETLGDDLSAATIVVVGAGQLALGVVRSLLTAPQAVGQVTIVNRTVARAEALVAEVADERLVVGAWDDLSRYLATARLVVTAVEAPSPVITASQMAGCRQPVLLVDLGMPRTVATELDEMLNVRRVDIGDLRERVARALDGRHDAFDAAHAMVLADVEKYLADQRARGAATIVRELRDHFDEVVATELSRHGHELDQFSEEQRARITSIVRSVVAKIAHRPTVSLKEAAGTDRGTRLSETTRALFDL